MADNAKVIQEKKPIKKKLQTLAAALAVIAVAVGSVVYGIYYVKQNEGTIVLEPEHVQSLTAPTSDAQGVIDYYSSLLEKINDPSSVKVDVKKGIDIPKDSVVIENDSKGLYNDLMYVRTGLTDDISDTYYEDFTGVYGEDFEGNVPICSFSASDVDKAVFTEGADEQALGEFGEKALKENDNESYNYIYISFPSHTLAEAEHSALNESFRLDKAQQVLDGIISDMSDTVQIVSSDIVCSDFDIRARANRFTDEIDYAVYTRNYILTLNVRFIGALAAYGEQTVKLEFDASDTYKFSYAGLRITEKVLYVERGDEVEIPDTLGIEEADEETITIKWSSSDESIATVNNDGYVKGHTASTEPIVVSGSVEYLGHTYNTQCQVYVVDIVKNISISQKSLALDTGATQQLTYALSPENATIKGALWFSDNEAVATVDENGVVTAVSPGNANVYVVSVSENYKSTCVVTVK